MKTKNILFIHGITSFGNSHFRLKHFLSTNGYVVHNPDLPGHGDNKMPLTDFEGMVKFVCDYIKTNIKNEPFILMGHSMGGGIAQIICNKFEKQISLLILECPLSAAIVNFSNNKQLKYDYENNIKPINISSDNNQLSNSSNVDSLAQWLGSKISYLPLLLEIISPKILNLLNKSSVCVKNINTLLILGKDDTVVPSYSTLYYFRNINKKINYEIFDTNHNPFREKSAEFIETINKFIEQNNK